jgi:hypothetical protein
MKKFIRLLLFGVALLAVLLLAVAGVALTPAFQTWAARRMLTAQPGATVSLGRLAAGWQRVRVETLSAGYGGAVLTLPVAEVQLSVLDAALHERVTVSRLIAKGWTLDLTKYSAPGAGAVAPASPAAEAAATAVALVFRGVFEQLKLPVDLALDGVELEGELVLPGTPGQAPARAAVTLHGGGLAAGRDGRFVFAADIALAGRESPVNKLEVSGSVEATMDTARTFTRLAAKVDAIAGGSALPQAVHLTAEAVAARVAGGENYTFNVQSVGKRLVDLQASFPADSARLGGVWKLDVRDTDLAPFVLGQSLPTFAAVGAGMFETDTGFKAIHAAGRLQSSADRLASFRPELAAVGALSLFGEFDVTLHDGAVRIDQLKVNVSSAAPVLTVQSLQAFVFNPGTGELKVANPAADLLVINLQGVPVGWVAPFVQPYTLSGGAVRGELKAGAAGGGLALRSGAPLQIDGLALAEAGRPLLAKLDLALDFSADYSPQGWQVDLAELRASSGGVPWLSLSAKAGRLAGRDQLTKATGRWRAALPGLLQQPFAQDSTNLTRGQLQGAFTGSLGLRQELQASFRADDLAVSTGEVLPIITAELRADVAGAGQITFNMPLAFENQAKARRSDIGLAGTLQVRPEGLKADARVTSQEIFIEDVQLLAALLSPPVSTPAPDQPRREETQPFWHGVSGQLAVALKKLHYHDQFEVGDVQGTVLIERGALKFERIRAGLGEGASANASGGLLFDAQSAQPYTINADLDVRNFNSRPLFLALNPGQTATVDGNFNITSQLTGRAATLANLTAATRGNFQLTSKGGVFHGLPVSVAGKVETTNRIASGVAAVGSLLGSMTGRKEYGDIASRAQAVSELSKTLSAIPYDQLSVIVVRDDTLAAVLKNFTLISPELRLTGVGEAGAKPGTSLLDGPLAMEFKLRARGRTAHLLKFLGALEAEPDELGYAACNLPLRIGGTLSQPDTGELNRALTNLAIDKSGAGELLNKLLGGGK